MRLSLWLILIFAFSVGMCCALAVRFFYFEAASVTARTSEPTTKILVAKRTIPSGIEITADFVVFQDVPISEVPAGSLTSFAQAYRRQSAFPIPTGCPICEDLLLPQTASAMQTAFVPTGSQVVALDIVHIRQGDRVFSPQKSLSAMLSADRRVDIRVVPPEAQGRLAEKKNEVIRTFGAQNIRDSGELVLENVPIHRTQRLFAADHTGLTRDSLELMLDNNEASRLTAAARRGQIRILIRQDDTDSQPTKVENVFEIADLPVQESSDSLLLEQSLSLDIPHIQEQEHSSPISAKPDPATPVDYVQKVAPAPADIFGTALLPPLVSATTVLPLMRAEETSPNGSQRDEHLHRLADSFPMESSAKETNTIRNDGKIAFGTSSFRVITPTPDPFPTVERERAPTPVESPPLPSLMDNPQQGVPDHIQSIRAPETAIGPRTTASTVQFRAPGNVASVEENPREVAWEMEMESALLLPSLIPSATSPPVVTRERVPGYSPFERRAYTVLPNEGFSKSLAEELQAPQRLIRSSNSRPQTQ